MTETQKNALIQALLNPRFYQYSVDQVELLETHISWVLLAGEFAYKIKKPVDFGFLDFSTLEKRERCCRDELRLNQRLAEQLYISVVPISGTADAPELGVSNSVIEYAVKMHRFPQENLFDVIANADGLLNAPMQDLADRIAHFHLTAPSTPTESSLGEPQGIHHWFNENFQQIKSQLKGDDDRQKIDELQQWGNQQFGDIEILLEQRKANGFIRECHGDLHLGNIVAIDNQAICFDCIEFNDELRWVDVLSELAFLFMDIDRHGYLELAYELLNRYLEITGDYEGLAVFRYYLVYRALVRAKVTLLKQTTEPDWAQYRHYIELALKYIQPAEPILMVTMGYSGSGKSRWARKLIGPLAAIQLRSDVERKRLFNLKAQDRSGSSLNDGIYSQSAGELTYTRLQKLAGQLIHANFSVIVDAACLKFEQRNLFRSVAERLSVKFLLLNFTAPPSLLRQRVAKREKKQDDASEAGESVLIQQLTQAQALNEEEQKQVLEIATDQTIDVNTLLKAIKHSVKFGV